MLGSMSRAYSEDLRQRIVGAVASGQTHAAAAARFAVSTGSVKRYAARARAGESLAAKRHPGKVRTIPPALHEQLVTMFEADPDATLAAYCRRWEHQTGVRVSAATMQRAQRRVGWTRKKSP